ncbi:DUF4416 family protein [bacterium]|nr:DUF4416 family protein [candidate division CSSED10-310 bacterium]
MGRPRLPQPVKFFTGLLYGSAQDVLDRVREQLVDALGPIDYASPEYLFSLTDYYAAEMGNSIRRCFWSFERVMDPGCLPEIKIVTNRVEGVFADSEGRRPVNLDPGYLDFYKMVLASVKERAQKIYLSRGIYADPTLFYLKGRWHPYEWSLPDFKTAVYDEVFQRIRQIYRDNMRSLQPGDVRYLPL